MATERLRAELKRELNHMRRYPIQSILIGTAIVVEIIFFIGRNV